MSKDKPRHKKNGRESFAIKLIITILLTFVISIVFVFSPMGNNQLRKLPIEGDTPLDSIAKGILINQVNKSKVEGEVDSSILGLRDFLHVSTVKEIIEVNGDKVLSVDMLKKKLSIDDESAHVIVNEIMGNSITKTMISNVEASKWIKFYKGFNELQTSGDLFEIKENVSKAQNIDAKELQSEASDLLNNRD